ncbi:MAG: Gfo/Idh/MocA family protein [Bacillota bacterium]
MLKIGIIGAGVIGTYHEGEISKLNDCKITAVCDIRKDAARKIAEKHNAKVYEDYRDLLNTEVDIVYICTPPHLHKEMAVAAAEAGKHIFLEKPMALTYEDGIKIKQAVDKAGVKCQIGYVVGFRPVEDRARRILNEGKVGNLIMAWDFRMSNGSVKVIKEGLDSYRDWLNDKNRGGGVLIECMTHEIAWLISLGGEVDSVYGQVINSPVEGIKVDDNHGATINFKSGGFGVLGTSWSSPAGFNSKGIVASEGNMKINSDNLILGVQNEEVKELEGRADIPESKQKYFNECVKNDIKPINSIEEALYNLKVMFAIHAASEKNQVIKVK